MSKIKKLVTSVGMRSAIKNTGWFCRSFIYQPKVPAKLLEMKKCK